MIRNQTIILMGWISVVVGMTIVSAATPQNSSSESKFAFSKQFLELIQEVRSPIMNAVAERFGNPSQPAVPDGLPVDASVVQGQQVYAERCARCHGPSGDGSGMKNENAQSKPRDFRLGHFKWKSTSWGKMPLRHDLRETLRIGIPGTAMPSFADLTERDRDAVVEYVRWLGMVGEFESRLSNQFNDFSAASVAVRIAAGEKRRDIAKEADQEVKTLLPDVVPETLSLLQNKWTESELESSIVRPKIAQPADVASVKRGRELYLSQATKCDACHGAKGKGDGSATRDFWPIPGSVEKYPEPGLHDYSGNLNQPWDLNTGFYRGGNSPEDLYRRIYAGIGGTSMPAYGGGSLSDVQIWDLVNYVQSLHRDGPQEPKSKPRQAPPMGNKD